MAAEDSILQANAVAAELPASQAGEPTHAAANAFTEAMGIGFGVAVAAATAVRIWLPARHRSLAPAVLSGPEAAAQAA